MLRSPVLAPAEGARWTRVAEDEAPHPEMHVPGPNQFTGKPRSQSTGRHQTERHFRLYLVRQVPNRGWSRCRIRRHNSCSVLAIRSRQAAAMSAAAVRQFPFLPPEASRRPQTTRGSDPPPIRRSHKGRAWPCSLGRRSCIDMNRRRDTIGRGQKSGRAGPWYGKSSERLGKAVSGAVRAALARRACTTVWESHRNPPRDSGRPKRPKHGVGRVAFHAATSGLGQRSHPNAVGWLPGVPPSEVPGSVAHGRKKVRSGVLLADVCNRGPLKRAGSRTGQLALIEVEGQAPVPLAAEVSRPQVQPRRHPRSSCRQRPASRVAYTRRIAASPFADNRRVTDGRPSGGIVPDANETERRPRWEAGRLLRAFPLPSVSTKQDVDRSSP